MSTDAMHGINNIEHCTISSACMHLSYCLLDVLLNVSALLTVPWAFLAGICSSWVSYPALSADSLLGKPFSFLCPWMNFNASHVSYLSSQGQGVPEFNTLWEVEVIYRRHRHRLQCSMINKIKVVSSIRSTWLESGRVGPRTSVHVLVMRKMLSLPRVKPWLSSQCSDTSYPSSWNMGNEKRKHATIRMWSASLSMVPKIWTAPVCLKIPRSCPLVHIIMIELTWKWICSTAERWQNLKTSCPSATSSTQISHRLACDRTHILTDYKLTT